MAYTSSTNVPTLESFLVDLIQFAVTYGGFANAGTFTFDTDQTARKLSKNGIFFTFLHEQQTVSSITGGTRMLKGRMTYLDPTSESEFLNNGGQEFPTGMITYKNIDGPYTGYYFYTDGTCVHAVLEVFPDIFTHISFGVVEKSSTWVGGEYISGSAYIGTTGNTWRNLINNDHSTIFDGGKSDRSTSTGSGARWAGYVRRQNGASLFNDERDFARIGDTIRDSQRAKMTSSIFGIVQKMCFQTPNTFNLRVASFPIYCRFYNSVTLLESLQGLVPNVRALNVKNIANAEIVETEWQAFPLTQKSPGDASIAPDNDRDVVDYGIIYKRIPPAV